MAATHGYGYALREPGTDLRPLVALEVDGVIALDRPAAVAHTVHHVSAWARWRRTIAVPEESAAVVHRLAVSCEIVWTGTWSFCAHEALRDILDLPGTPWGFLPAQIDVAAAVHEYAAGRPWAWITEQSAASPGSVDDGTIVRLDPRRGLADLDPDLVLAALTSLDRASIDRAFLDREGS